MSCCTSGFSWSGTPVGQESQINNTNVYITGSNHDVAILLLHDIFGWKFGNNRLLADHFAREVGATVYLPDFFDGEVITEEMLFDPEKLKDFDIQGFIQRNNKETRGTSIHDFARNLKTEMGFKKVGAVGYCWGGWAAFQLGGKDENLIDALSTAHPTFLTKEEINNVAVPVQILAPETDPRFTPELKEHANKVIPTLGVEYDYQYFPGLAHGFACRADEGNEVEKRGLERAKNAVSGWFGVMLH
ncbi:MAG: hypothetical protein Q9221_007683 [Calogaya cf. arnoldii]